MEKNKVLKLEDARLFCQMLMKLDYFSIYGKSWRKCINDDILILIRSYETVIKNHQEQIDFLEKSLGELLNGGKIKYIA